MKRKIAFALTMIICSLILIGAQIRTNSNNTPENTILRVIKAAEEGDCAKYTSCFCEDLKTLLEKRTEGMGEEVFKQRILKSYRDITGIAIREKTIIDEDELDLKVELVFEDSDEMKIYSFKRIRDEWKIKKIADS